MWLPDRKGFSLRAEAVYYFGEKGMNTFFLWKTIFCIVNCACGMLLHFKNILGVYLQNLCFCNTVSHVNSLFDFFFKQHRIYLHSQNWIRSFKPHSHFF